MFLLLEEVEGEEFVEVAAVELDGCGPVEVSEGNAFFEARLEESSFELLSIAALDLVGEDEGEEGGVVELLGTRAGKAVGQRGDGLSQLEALEEGDEISFKVHVVASFTTGC